MSILKSSSKTQVYNLDIGQIKGIIIKDLGYTPTSIYIETAEKCISSDPMGMCPPICTFNGLKITITE